MSSHVQEKFEDRKNDLAVKDFGGVNTQAGRTAIAENEFAWLENLMPIGHANLKAVPHQGVSVATLPTSSVTYWKYVNLLNVDYLAEFSADGAGRLLNLATYAFTTIGAAGTFTLPVSCAQWENERLLIIDAHNYYSWDGTLLLKNGSVESITITNPGSGYVAVATVTFSGGGGFGAAVSVAMQLSSVTLAAAGTGYSVGDIVTLAGGTFTVPAKLRVDTIGGAGDITAGTIYETGSYTVLPATPNTPTGGTGVGCQLGLKWGVASATVTNGGTVPYLVAPTVTFSAGPTTTATGTAEIMAGPDGGQTISTFAGRVWISNARTWSYSAPDSFTDFTTANGGGSFIVTDETLKSNITGALVANNFLYYWGDSSIAVISDVRVTGTPAVTVFSNNNVSPIIGSNYAASIVPYYRNIGFATPFGFYALIGASPQKMSDPLDGIFEHIDFTKTITSAVVKLFNILCMAFCFQYNDPDTGDARALLAIFFNKKWFFCSQGNGITLIAGGFVSGVPTLYGTDARGRVYKLFSDVTAAIETRLVTALWPMKEPTRTKQTLKGGIEARTSDVQTTIDVQVDTDSASYPLQLSADNVGLWVNSAGVVGQWYNTVGVLGGWITVGFQIFQGDIEAYGRYVGYTVTSQAPGYSIEGLLMQFERKANWATKAS